MSVELYVALIIFVSLTLAGLVMDYLHPGDNEDHSEFFRSLKRPQPGSRVK